MFDLKTSKNRDSIYDDRLVFTFICLKVKLVEELKVMY